VDPGGEIIAIDAAGYGAVTITKSVTITANPGTFAGIAASTGNAVTIASAGVHVILRGLNINGIGASNGVSMTAGASLSVENCVISNFTNWGISVAGTTARVRILDTLLRGNGAGIRLDSGPWASIAGVRALANNTHGIEVSGTVASTLTQVNISDSHLSDNNLGGLYVRAQAAGSVVRTSVSRSVAAHNSAGIATDASTGIVTMTLYGNLVTGNNVGTPQSGIYAAGGTTVESTGANTVRQNGIDVNGTVTPVPAI
jgi:hypothetical protein